MAYASGRSIKSAKRYQPTSVASATREARKLVNRHLPIGGVTVDSTLTAHPTTLAPMVRTVITFPEMADASDLALAVESLPGHLTSTWTNVNITILRTA